MASRLCRNISSLCTKNRHRFLCPVHNVLIQPAASSVTIYEIDRKSGYDPKIPKKPIPTMIKEGIKMIYTESLRFKQEVIEKFSCDGYYITHHGDYQYFWKFNGKSSLDPWTVTADQDHNEGSSSCNLTVSKNNKALFHGFLSTDVPKDGVIKRAGYVNLRSPFNMKSFHRIVSYDFSRYTHLYMKVRGDGRTYMVTLAMNHYFDLLWNDQYQFPLHTRGGPYWQITKIPFSKFMLSHKGRIQDKQFPIPQNNIRFLAFTLGDNIDGPFSLEIDYIGLVLDTNHDEEFAYEMYQAEASHIGF
ncbi:hypothetical protein ACJMK2_036090 [Sinanodonta woodiana]|uniref:NADH:ubiquinone oxidoreductase intermediate-associated protein 30 domain-containing protein n=1 Tax=Sinanodonta woodiana TaxID=1069815 RepID=A0ABD3WG42_SINWO